MGAADIVRREARRIAGQAMHRRLGTGINRMMRERQVVKLLIRLARKIEAEEETE
jgi:hypothetical protein